MASAGGGKGRPRDASDSKAGASGARTDRRRRGEHGKGSQQPRCEGWGRATLEERDRDENGICTVKDLIQSPLGFEPGAKQLLDEFAELQTLQFPKERELDLVVGVLSDIGGGLFKIRMPALSWRATSDAARLVSY